MKTKGAVAIGLGEEAAAAFALKIELDVGVLGVGVLGMATTGMLGARVMGSPSKALGTPKVLAGAAGFGAGGEAATYFEGVEVGRVNAAAAARALPRGVFFGVTPLRNTCTRANSWVQCDLMMAKKKALVLRFG